MAVAGKEYSYYLY